LNSDMSSSVKGNPRVGLGGGCHDIKLQMQISTKVDIH